jgi:hypothetical protein
MKIVNRLREDLESILVFMKNCYTGDSEKEVIADRQRDRFEKSDENDLQEREINQKLKDFAISHYNEKDDDSGTSLRRELQGKIITISMQEDLEKKGVIIRTPEEKERDKQEKEAVEAALEIADKLEDDNK